MSSNGRSNDRKDRPKVFGKELPDMDTDEEFQANWKITKAREELLLLEFHKNLSSAGLLQPEHDKYYIRRFLRARQHDLDKAQQMYADHIRWRKEFNVAGIVNDFKFTERDLFLTLYPQGYHKTDKLGRPIYIQHLGAINMKRLNEITTEERMLQFHVQEYERCMNYIMPACSKVMGHHVEQTFAIIDVTGVGMSHVSGQVKTLLSKITSVDQGNYPEMMGKTFIINAPGMFKLVWGIVKRFLDARTLAKIELVGTNYQATLLKYVDRENLPEYLGGTSKATLLDDVGPWQDQAIVDEIEADRRNALSQDVEADSTRDVAPMRMDPSRRSSGGDPSNLRLPVSNSRKYAPAEMPASLQANGDSQVFHEATPNYSRSLSIASEDEGYYSPRSDSTFTSFSERSQYLDEPSSRPYQENVDGFRSGVSSPQQASLAARVRKLEEAIPGLKQKLAPELDLRPEASFNRTGLLARVEVLEGAIDVLLTAQEEKLIASRAVVEDPEIEQSKQCCTCCTIM